MCVLADESSMSTTPIPKSSAVTVRMLSDRSCLSVDCPHQQNIKLLHCVFGGLWLMNHMWEQVTGGAEVLLLRCVATGYR